MLLTFIVLTFGWTWSLWIAGAALRMRAPELGATLLILAGFGPTLAGLITVWSFERAAGLRHWMQRCMQWRMNPIWYAVVFFGPPLAMLAAIGIDVALGGAVPASPAAGHIGRSLLQFGSILFIGGPLGEEFGWRGFVLPALTTRFGWRWAALIVGAVWGLWHLPLFFIPGSAQAQMPIALFMASSLCLSVLMARMSITTRFSVLPALMFHWAINAWPAFIPIIPKGGNVRPYVLVMSILLVIAIIVFVKRGPRNAHGSVQP